MASKIDLDLIVARCHDLLDRIHTRERVPSEVEFEPYSVVAVKLCGYAINTFKSIYYLIPHKVYEQATVLYRSLWETGVNLEWISLDPEKRALRFREFTAVEHRKFIENRIRDARADDNPDAVLALTRQQAAFEKELDSQLSVFSYSDQRGRQRWRDRHSAFTNIIPSIFGRVTLCWRYGALRRCYRMNQKVKEFDSVQLMRTLRDQMSEDMAQMSPQERILYIQRKAAASPLLALFSQQIRTQDAEQVVRADG